MSLLKAQVTRSAELPLEVEICSWGNGKAEEGCALRDVGRIAAIGSCPSSHVTVLSQLTLVL